VAARCKCSPPPPAALVNQPNEPIRITRRITPTRAPEPPPATSVGLSARTCPAGSRSTFRPAVPRKVDMSPTPEEVPCGRQAPHLHHQPRQRLRHARHGHPLRQHSPTSRVSPTTRFRLRRGHRLPSASDLDHHHRPKVACTRPRPRPAPVGVAPTHVNRLEQNVRWTQYANLMSVPTDCRSATSAWAGW